MSNTKIKYQVGEIFYQVNSLMELKTYRIIEMFPISKEYETGLVLFYNEEFGTQFSVEHHNIDNNLFVNIPDAIEDAKEQMKLLRLRLDNLEYRYGGGDE